MDLIFAVSDTTLGISSVDDAGRPLHTNLGYDDDGVCTGEGQGPSCLEPPSADGDHHDGVDGIDNAYGQLFALSGGGSWPVDETPASADLPNILFRVRDYSGEPNDERVRVAVYVASGVARSPDGGVRLMHDGTDRWLLFPETLASPDAGAAADGDFPPRFEDEGAYVTDGTLVARFPEMSIPSGVGTSLEPVEQVIMTGQLEPGSGGTTWQLRNVVLGLRLKAQTLLANLGRYVLTLTDGGIEPACIAPANYEYNKKEVCSLVDITTIPSASTSAVCDALSVGWLLDAEQAEFGGVGPDAGTTPAPNCRDLPPTTDTCAASADP